MTMHIVVVGLNHHSASVEVRERASFSEEGARAAQEKLRQQGGVYEAAILSTCNRVEVYVVSVCASAGEVAARSVFHGDEPLYVHKDVEAVEHLFRVAAGVESMVVGETQILGQVRRAFEAAQQWGGAGRVLSALFQQALRTGKRARTETEIGHHAVSVSSAAIDLARRSLDVERGASALIIGTGEIARHALDALRNQRVAISRLYIASRTLARAQAAVEEWQLSNIAVETITEDAVEAILGRVNLVIAATAVSGPMVSASMLERAVASRTEALVIVDLGVPRNIDPMVRGSRNVNYFDMDDVQSAIAVNGEARLREVGSVKRIAAEEAEEFMSWMKALWVQPLVVGLRSRAEEIRFSEFERAMARLRHLSDQDRRDVEALTETIIRKLLHEPTVRLKENAGEPSGHLYAEALRSLFNLEEQG